MRQRSTQHASQIGRRGAEWARARAEAYARDPDKARRLLDRALRKAKHERGRLGEARDSLMTLTRLVRAWASGTYPAIPWQTLVLTIGAILYFVIPLDLVPDWIAGLGYIDDASVIAFVLNAIRHELDAFLAWENTADNEHASGDVSASSEVSATADESTRNEKPASAEQTAPSSTESAKQVSP